MPDSLQVVTEEMGFLVYDQQTSTPVTHFDGLTIFYYNSASSVTLYQSNQYTINLGTRSSVYDFLSSPPTQFLVNDLVKDSTYAGRFDKCGAWLVGLEYNPMGDGRWLAFYHGENRIGFDDACGYQENSAGVVPESNKAMGIAFSSDNGLTFPIDKSAGDFSNAIITSPSATTQPAGHAGDGVYFRSSVIPNYRYILYTQDGKTCLARAQLDCLDQTWCWHKYYDNTWDEAGIRGDCQTIDAFQPGASRSITEISHHNGNYLMAVELSQYGGALLYFTEAINPQGPWTQYNSSVLYHAGFRDYTNVVSATFIYTNAPGAGNSKVINENEDFIIAYTVSTTNIAAEGAAGSESMVLYQPIKLYGLPSSWTGSVLNPIRTFFTSFSSVLYSWTTNLVYSPTAKIYSTQRVGYVPTFTNVIGYNRYDGINYVWLYTCQFNVTVGSNPSVAITDVRITTVLPNIETRPPDGGSGVAACPNSATASQYIGFALTSQNSSYAMQQVYLCVMNAYSYSTTFHYLSNDINCYGHGSRVTTSPPELWIFTTATGH